MHLGKEYLDQLASWSVLSMWVFLLPLVVDDLKWKKKGGVNMVTRTCWAKSHLVVLEGKVGDAGRVH